MKNLANCKPSEFLAQTVKIRRSVDKWLTVTDVLNIRKHKPEGFDEITSYEAKENAIAEQAKKNLLDMFDSAFEAHPDETLELLALLCFVDPAKVDEHPMSDYLAALSEMLNDESVMGFFTSLVRLGQKNTLTA